MLLHASLGRASMTALGPAASRAEDDGFDGAWVLESSNDPFVRLTAAATATRRAELATGVAIAFGRTPMTVAASAWDVHELSGGRLVLGLGTQVRAHVERRYGMPWSAPAARMREFVLALRAIWASWHEDTPLRFTGRFYSHTLMPPAFRPAPSALPTPPVLLGGVGPRMVAVVGEVADGFLAHTLTSRRYLDDELLPGLAAAARGVGRPPPEPSGLVLVATGRDETELKAAADRVRHEIAFYASTPAYRPVLDHHGWTALSERAHTTVREGRWDDLGGLVDDEVLDTFAIVAPPERVRSALEERFGAVYRRAFLYSHLFGDADLWRTVVTGGPT